MHQIRFSDGALPQTPLGEGNSRRSPDLLVGLRKTMDEKWREGKMEEKREGKVM